jgi:hypothetical protein
MPIADEEVRTVIDKLAVFVAKNGDAFENITKEKQRDNPKFAFLFGGEVRYKHLASEILAAVCSLSDTLDRPCTGFGTDRDSDLANINPSNPLAFRAALQLLSVQSVGRAAARLSGKVCGDDAIVRSCMTDHIGERLRRGPPMFCGIA